MKKMFKRMLALTAALAIVMSVPAVCSADPEKEQTTKPPVYVDWDDDSTRN